MAAITWTGAAGDGNYNNAANWSPKQVPGAGDTVTISTPAASAIGISGADAVAGLTTNKNVTLNLSNNSSYTIGSGASAATFANNGTFTLNSGGNSTDLIVGGAKLTLSGTGTIMLGDNGNNAIYGAAASDQLINTSNLIEGGGQLGAGQLTFTNSTAGTVNANLGTTLVLNTGTNTVTNSGLLEATGTGGLVIQSTINNGTGGHITAAGGVVSLNTATIQGGTLSSSGGGQIDINNGTLDGTAHTVVNTGTVQVDNNNGLTLLGTITNSGTILVDSVGNGTVLGIGPTSGTAGTVTLTGGGTVVMTDNGNNYITDNLSGDTLVNLNNTIAGAGIIGSGALSLTNDGTINANGGNALYLNATGTVINNGLMEATNTGGLYIQTAVNNAAGTVLAKGQDVYLQNSLAGGTVSSTGTAALVVENGTLIGTTSAVTNTGSILVANNDSLYVAGTLNNTGTITIGSVGNGTFLQFDSATVTLTGGGVINTTDNGNNYLTDAATGDGLDNVNNTINASGQLGDGTFAVTNAGTINANGTNNALYINSGVAFTNTGLLEATGAAGLVIQDTISNGTSGVITAAGGNVTLSNGTVAGGTLTASSGGGFYTSTGTFDGSVNTVFDKAAVQVDNNTVLTLLGTISNASTITLDSVGNGTALYIGPSATSGTVTLTGHGQVVMSDNSNNTITNTSNSVTDLLVNLNNTISGAGQIGAGALSLTNDATIDATGGNALILNASGIVTNNALLEATGTGGLLITDTVNNSSTGTVLAAGGNVVLQGSIVGGLVSSTGTAALYAENGSLVGTGSAVTNSGSIVIVNDTSLYISGTIDNTGTITLGSSGNATQLQFDSSTVTLTGGGVINTTDNGNNYLTDAVTGDGLVNLNNTINASGQFGDGTFAITNDGTINANGTNNVLILNNGGAFTNAGLVEATGAAGMVITTTVNNGSTGQVKALNSAISLNGGAIAGGTISSTGTGGFYSNNGTLDGSAHTLTNNGYVQVDNNNYLYVLGTIANAGTITLASGGNATVLEVASPTLTLTGSGLITTSDNGNNYFFGASGTDVLDNINNTIDAAGQFGDGQLTYINESKAVLDATGGNALVINANSFTNDGLVEATGTGGITLQTRISNASGTIAAAGSAISLNGGTIAGGLITSSAGGGFYSNGGTLDGSASTLTNKGFVQVDNNNSLYVLGTIANSGTITIASGGNATVLEIVSPTLTLTGGGLLTTSDNGNNYIYAASGTDVLDNVNNTIDAAGQLGDGQLTLINSGTIAATGGNALIVNLGSTGTNTATGQMLGVGSGGLIFQNGTYTDSGLIQADNGSSVTFQSGAILTNDSAKGTLTGGTYGAVATGSTATVSITGTAVTTDKADIILSGTGSEISFGGVAIETSLKTIGAAGELQVLGGRNYTTKAHIANSGTIVLGGGTFKPGALKEGAGSLLSGFGTVSAKLTDSGSIVATGGTLDLSAKGNTIDGAISGTGTLAFGGTDTLGAGTTLAVSSIALLNKASLAIATNVSFAGTFNVTGTASLTGTGTFASSGLFEATGKAVGSISDPFSSSGTISIGNTASLAFTGGLANTGLILDSGTFTDTAALTGGSLTLANGTASHATIASMAGAGNSTIATLTTAGGALNTSGTTLTVTGDYNNTAAGVGNSYTPFAGITGTIDGQGTKLAVVGVNGTTITTVNGTLTIAITAGGTAQFEIENTGAAGSAALRGALQTTVNGGSITGTALSGSGVTAADFGPITAGAASGTYSIHYSGGTLTNEAIHLASDFANVAGLTIDIVAQTGAQTVAGLAMPDMQAALAWQPLILQH